MLSTKGSVSSAKNVAIVPKSNISLVKKEEKSVLVQGSGEKQFTLPLDMPNYKTFIDHGCQMDKEGYPLYPNENTVFVWLPGQEVTNFGTVGFSKTVGINFRRHQKWKVTRIYCLGALVCDREDCKWGGAPATGRGKIEEYLESYVAFLFFLQKNY